MAYEVTNVAPQTVAANANVIFDATPVCSGRGISRRAGSGIITLSGCGTRCGERHLVTFGANVAIPTGGTVEAISLAIALEGEPLGSATMIVTPAAVEDLWNVFAAVFVDVPPCGDVTLTVRNTSAQAVIIQNANLIVA